MGGRDEVPGLKGMGLLTEGVCASAQGGKGRSRSRKDNTALN